MSKLGSISRVRREVDYAKQAANEESNQSLEVIVYRPPIVTNTCWLGLNMGFDMTVEDGNTIVSRVHSNGSAFDNGIKSGDIVVAFDGVRVSSPSTSLKRANMMLHQSKNAAINERRRVIKCEFCRGR